MSDIRDINFGYIPLGFNDHDPDAVEFLNVFLVIPHRDYRDTSINRGKVVYLTSDEIFHSDKTIEESLREKVLKWKKYDFSKLNLNIEYCRGFVEVKDD